MTPLSPIVTLTAVVLTLYFLIAGDAYLRSKIIVGALLAFSFAAQYWMVGWDLVGFLLQVLLSIGLLMFFKVRPSGA